MDEDKIEKQMYELLMSYIEKKYPELSREEDSKQKYDLYLRLLDRMKVKYLDYLRDYFINFIQKAETHDRKSDEKLLKAIEEEIEKLN